VSAHSFVVFQKYGGPPSVMCKHACNPSSGHLTAKEVAAALRSRNVNLTEAIVQKFIEGVGSSAAQNLLNLKTLPVQAKRHRVYMYYLDCMCSAASDADSNDTVERDEFASLILHMASADLRSKVRTTAAVHREVFTFLCGRQQLYACRLLAQHLRLLTLETDVHKRGTQRSCR
jgi:hypothetical protein